MSIEQRIAFNKRVINRGISTLTRATKPEHIAAAHARIDRAEDNIARLQEQADSGNP